MLHGTHRHRGLARNHRTGQRVRTAVREHHETLLADIDTSAQFEGELWDGADPEGDESHHWLYYTPTNLTETRDSYQRATAETKHTPHQQVNQKKRREPPSRAEQATRA